MGESGRRHDRAARLTCPKNQTRRRACARAPSPAVTLLCTTVRTRVLCRRGGPTAKGRRRTGRWATAVTCRAGGPHATWTTCEGSGLATTATVTLSVDDLQARTGISRRHPQFVFEKWKMGNTYKWGVSRCPHPPPTSDGADGASPPPTTPAGRSSASQFLCRPRRPPPPARAWWPERQG